MHAVEYSKVLWESARLFYIAHRMLKQEGAEKFKLWCELNEDEKDYWFYFARKQLEAV